MIFMIYKNVNHLQKKERLKNSRYIITTICFIGYDTNTNKCFFKYMWWKSRMIYQKHIWKAENEIRDNLLKLLILINWNTINKKSVKLLASNNRSHLSLILFKVLFLMYFLTDILRKTLFFQRKKFNQKI